MGRERENPPTVLLNSEKGKGENSLFLKGVTLFQGRCTEGYINKGEGRGKSSTA